MKELKLTSERRKQLTDWLMEQPAKFANPVLQFLQEVENETPPVGGGGGGAPKKPKDE